jgi:tetratricopeptide (TPR) repeat protein
MFYNVAADYHRVSQDLIAATGFCQSSLALALSTGNLNRQSKALHQRALIKRDSGDFPGSATDAVESQKVAKICGNMYLEACALAVEAFCWQSLGSYSRCKSLLDRATHLLNLCGMSSGELYSAIRHCQITVHFCKSEYVEACNIHIQILREISEDQKPFHYALNLLNIALIDVEIGGSGHEVQQNLQKAALLYQTIKYPVGIVWCDTITAALDGEQGNSLAARNQFQKHLQSAWGKDQEAATYCLEKLGAVHQWDPVVQVSWTVTFFVHSVKSKQRLELHRSLQFLGDVFSACGDPETALSLFTIALDGFTQMDVHRSRAECMVRLGEISLLSGDELRAAELWETARPLFERSSQGTQLDELNTKRATLSYTSSV